MPTAAISVACQLILEQIPPFPFGVTMSHCLYLWSVQTSILYYKQIICLIWFSIVNIVNICTWYHLKMNFWFETINNFPIR